MFPIFIPPQDSEGTPDEKRRRRMVGVMLGLGVAVFLMVSLLFTGRAGSVSIMPMIIAVAIIVIGVGALVSFIPRSREKQKRGLDGQDMYTLIDRMVDDLDEDEVGYLQTRLDERDPHQDAALSDYEETGGKKGANRL